MGISNSIQGLLSQDAHKANEIVAVWLKGIVDPRYNPAIYRQDAFGWWMRFSDYGDRNSDYGWEIDHVHPTGLGGFNTLNNKRPLHWRNNTALGGLVRGLLNP